MYLLNNVVSVALSTAVMVREPRRSVEGKLHKFPVLATPPYSSSFSVVLFLLVSTFIFLSSCLSTHTPSSLSSLSYGLFSFLSTSFACIFMFSSIIIFLSPSIVSSLYLLSLFHFRSYLCYICSFYFSSPCFSPHFLPFFFFFSFSQFS